MAKSKRSKDYVTGERVPTKTGKRTRAQFKRGNPGRPKGAKDKVPRGVKSSVKAILLDLAEHEPQIFHRLIRRGLRATPKVAFNYLQLSAHYIDGKPPDQLSVSDTRFKTDELKDAKDTLTRKLDQMLSVIVAQRTVAPGETPEDGKE